MRYELYVDSLFLVNFVMNLYILMLVNRSTFRTATRRSLLLGAALGGFGFLIPFLTGGPAALRMLSGMAVGTVGMLLAAFPIRGLINFLRLLEKTLFYSFCMGGAVFFLIRRLCLTEGLLTGIFAVMGAGGLFFLFLGRLPQERGLERCRCQATLIQEGVRRTIPALIDSGNSLVEPISGKPVSVVEEKVLRELMQDNFQGFRAIPYHSIGKDKGILEGYLLRELWLEMDGMKKTFHDVYIAVSPEPVSHGDDCRESSIKMIVNPRLLEEAKMGKPKRGQNERCYDTEGGNTGKTAV